MKRNAPSMERKGYTMRNILSLAAAAALTLGLMTGSLAAAKKPSKSAAMTCPVCKMPLSTKKTKANPREVTIKGKKYYCCAGCDMSSLTKGSKSKAKSSKMKAEPN